MSRALLLSGLFAVLLLNGCSSGGSTWQSGGSIGSLKGKKINVQEERIEGGLEKAIAGYKQFLEQTPEEEMTPEALRRLADLKIQSVEGVYDETSRLSGGTVPGKTKVVSPINKRSLKEKSQKKAESIQSIEKRSAKVTADSSAPSQLGKLQSASSMQQQILQDDASSREAIAIYRKLLKKYPDYERNDQVLYQLARAYGIRGQQNQAMNTLDRIIKEYPFTPLIDEVQFRRGEVLFVRKQYRASERAYGVVVKAGRRSRFYDQALYKHGWSLFKQSRYEEGLDSFIKLIDSKAAGGRAAVENFSTIERQRFDDTLRVTSFSFSYLGGSGAVDRYFQKRGRRPYEDMLFEDLGSHYLAKRRYADAAKTFSAFVERNPLHKQAPLFQIRVIEVYKKGGFPKLVIEAKREYARIYSLDSNYWKNHDINRSPKILAFTKQNLIDLASHYHALSQKRRDPDDYKEAIVWYRKYLKSFPQDSQTTKMNFLLAELLFDNRSYAAAAVEYEKTAYQYPRHEKSGEAGYAAVLAHRANAKQVKKDKKAAIVSRSIISSIRFADTYPQDKRAAGVLNQAAVDMYQRNEFMASRKLAQRVINQYPQTDRATLRSAWTVVAHSSFDLADFPQSEKAYQEALSRLSKRSDDRRVLIERLAATVYKQGEAQQKSGQLRAAVKNYVRVGQLAPDSKIRMAAEYDAGAVLIKLKDWNQAIRVFESYRKRYPGNPNEANVTEKLAVAYEENRQWQLAAREFDRIRVTTKDPKVRREATYRSAELYDRANNKSAAITSYQRFIKTYPRPVSQSIEARDRLATLYKKAGNRRQYEAVLGQIVQVDKRLGSKRTDRTRYLAAIATLELSEPLVREYKKIRLTLPLKRSMARKKRSMDKSLKVFTAMLDYGVADVTAAATYRIADIYYDLTTSILESDRPRKLNKLELEQYDILLEEQAYPFEEKSINLHKKNVELLKRGLYNEWIEKSINQLGELLPVQFAKTEVGEAYVASSR
ncbi:MAG: tetratricopeptide repeat protein [Acidiferrobacterales bacterium]